MVVRLLIISALLTPWLRVKVLSSCTSDADCEMLMGSGSRCREDSECSNPIEQGCLYKKLPGFEKKRVCNSDDPVDAAERGICRIPDLEYMELRIFSQNWESVFFECWILQVILSELLDVPTTIETGIYEARLNLYDPNSRFDYGNNDDMEALTVAKNVGGDCRKASREKDTYQGCAHFAPEIWDSDGIWVLGKVYDKTVEPPQGLGLLGQESWFITQFTVLEDPSLISYLGLQGDDKRQKLADLFLRPTTWKQYCDEVSPSNCTTPDNVTLRAPIVGTDEEDRMFVKGLYKGHFRKTEENDCETYPNSCTGHIADYPCGWSSVVEAQAYHLNIHLRSSGKEPGCRGYTYSQMKEMWAAANATRSNLIMYWWTPEALIHEFAGTDAEMTKISLPIPTQECVENRVEPTMRCSSNQTERVGNPLGACDDKAKPLEKLISGVLYDLTYSPDIDPAIRSPGYDVFRYFKLSELQLGEIFEYWKTRATPREAICDWVVDNMDYMETFVSPGYPRTTEKASNEILSYVSVTVGVVSTIVVIFTTIGVYRFRKKPAIIYAQVEFLFVLLAGAFLIVVGSTIQGLPASNGSCVAMTWLVNLGYTLEMGPLIVKVAAINRMMSAARSMRRIVIKRTSLFGAVFFLCVVMMVYLTAWTIVDIPQKEDEFELTDRENQNGDTIVEVSYFCASNSQGWQYGAVGWNVLLLLCATVIAYQTRNVHKKWNESRPLATMIYSHFVFVVLRMITVGLNAQLPPTSLQKVQSLLFSIDTVAGLAIYFIPKLAVSEEEEGGSSAWSSAGRNVAQRRVISGLDNQVTTVAENQSRAFSSVIPTTLEDSGPLDHENGDGNLVSGGGVTVQFCSPLDSMGVGAETKCKRCQSCGQQLPNRHDQEQPLLRSLDATEVGEDVSDDQISDEYVSSDPAQL